ncbi:Cysteine dioxygenase type I [compost metagenome]
MMLAKTRRLPPGSLGLIPSAMIHRQGISSDDCAQAISLHVYSPPLSELAMFDESSSRIERRTSLPYSNLPKT